MAQGKLGSGCEDFGQHDLAQGIELRLIAEEAGFANGDFIQQTHHLGLANGLDGEAFVVFAQSAESQLLHAPAAAVFQKAQLVVGMEDAGNLIDEIPNPDQIRVGRPVWRVGKRRGAVETWMSSLQASDGGVTLGLKASNPLDRAPDAPGRRR